MCVRRILWLSLLLAGGCAAEKANGRPWIHDLDIEGVKHVKLKDLRSKIALDDTSWVPLSPKHYLDPFEVDIDEKRIEAYYAAHGYFQAKVTEAEVSRSRAARRSTSSSSSTKGRRPRSTSSASPGSIRGPQGRTTSIAGASSSFKRGDVFDHAQLSRAEGARAKIA